MENYEIDSPSLFGNLNNLNIAAAALPDLTVTDISSRTSLVAYQPSFFWVTIKNIGNTSASNFLISIFYDGTNIGNFRKDVLIDGQSFMFQMEIGSVPAGNHSIIVALDYLNEIPESNKSNNDLIRNFTWSNPSSTLPDLFCNITNEPYSYTVSFTDYIDYKFEIMNGGVAITKPFVVAVGVDNEVLGTLTIQSLGANNKATGAFELNFVRNCLPHDIFVIADYTNVIAESNEYNNYSYVSNFPFGVYYNSSPYVPASVQNLKVAVSNALKNHEVHYGSSGSFSDAIYDWNNISHRVNIDNVSYGDRNGAYVYYDLGVLGYGVRGVTSYDSAGNYAKITINSTYGFDNLRDFRSTITHELGHVLGLVHPDQYQISAFSVMVSGDPSSPYAFYRTTNVVEYDVLSLNSRWP